MSKSRSFIAVRYLSTTSLLFSLKPITPVPKSVPTTISTAAMANTISRRTIFGSRFFLPFLSR